MFTYIFVALGIGAMIIFCIFRDKNSSVLAISLKTLASFFFIATAVTALGENESEQSVALLPSLLMIMGLVAGLIGDITLDLKIYLRKLKYPTAQNDSEIMTYVGMGAFGIGHILYITASAVRYPDTAINLLWSALVAILLIGIVMGVSIFVLKMRFGKFLIPSIAYGFLLSWFVVLSIWQLASQGSSASGILLLIGAIMFIISDLILSMTYFSKEEDYKKEGMMNPESKLMICANHATYYIAQFLIATAILYI